jgi:hypothetical protein
LSEPANIKEQGTEKYGGCSALLKQRSFLAMGSLEQTARATTKKRKNKDTDREATNAVIMTATHDLIVCVFLSRLPEL